MQLTKSDRNFDHKKVEQILISENKFITDLFSVLSLPTRNENDSEEEEKSNFHPVPQLQHNKSAKGRAQSLLELQQRLVTITTRDKLSYKEKLQKKGLKNRMKKKTKQDERNAKQKLLRVSKMMNGEEVKTEINGNGSIKQAVKPAKPVFNSEGKMVFSKFDFSDVGPKKHKKVEKDPKKLLKIMAKEKEMLKGLEECGEINKVVEIKEKSAWKNALAKAEGQKIKDDPVLLKKSVQRKEQQKRSSKKKWEAREQMVTNAKEERQKKRTENIDKRKKEKQKGKMKKAVKRGKIIPGF